MGLGGARLEWPGCRRDCDLRAARQRSIRCSLILVVGAVGYATVRLYLGKVEESTGHLHKLNELYLATIKALAHGDRRQGPGHARPYPPRAGLRRRPGEGARGQRRADAEGHRSRSAAARHRQDRGARAHPEQAGKAQRPGIRADEEPRHDRRGHPQRHRLPVSGDSLRPPPPRELGRHRLSGSARRRGDSSRRADSLGRGLLRCADVGSAVPARAHRPRRRSTSCGSARGRCTTRGWSRSSSRSISS